MIAASQDDREQLDIVLFLGAGFSHDAGLPTMPQFGDASKKDHDGLLKHVNAGSDPKKFRNAAPMLVESAKIFEAFRKFCRQSPTLTNSDLDNMETIYCIAEAMSESGLPDLELDNQKYKTSEVIRHIQFWLWKVYQQCPFLNDQRRDDTNPETYERFFGILKQTASNFKVVTTNYDLIFEYKCWEQGIQFAYPSDNVKPLNAGNDCKPYFCLKEQDKQSKIIISKLHGSVNYFNTIQDENSLYVSNDLFVEKPICGIRFNSERPAIFALDAIWNIRAKYGQDLAPAIVPPTYAKLTQQRWLRNIWSTALEALSNAKKIIFIGYSMPDSDGFITALMHSALAIRAANPDYVVPPKVYVIDPNRDSHKRYEALFHQIYKPLPPMSFSEASKSAIPEILGEQD